VAHLASVFTIDLSFSEDSELLFHPSSSELITLVQTIFQDSLRTLDSLSRILTSGAVRPHLYEALSNIGLLFETGPSFTDVLATNTEFERIEKHVITVIRESFDLSVQHSEDFKEFYPIFKTGSTWSANGDLKPCGGTEQPFLLTQTFSGKPMEEETLVYDSSTEIVVDSQRIRNDIKQFTEDQQSLARFRSCAVCGARYVDSRNLRALDEAQLLLRHRSHFVVCGSWNAASLRSSGSCSRDR
jgi:hypothetical protein